MMKKLLLTSALAIASITAVQAQSNALSNHLGTGQSIPGKIRGTGILPKHATNAVASVNCVDTNMYVYVKDDALNSTVGYYTYPSNPNMYGGTALGYSYPNTGTLTITGVGFVAVSSNTTVTVPSKAYLYNVNAAGVPTTKIDSMSVGVNTAKFYYGVLGTPRVITGNYAVVFRADYSATATQTIAMYMTPAQTATSTAVNNYGEKRGYLNAPTAGGWYAANAVFGGTATPTADYEPIVFPIYSYNQTADYTVTPTSPICITSTLVNTNTSLNGAVAEHYMYNFARFCKKWNLTPVGTLDSIYTWNFSDGTGRFKSKNQNHLYTVAGTYNDSLIMTNHQWSGAPRCIDRKFTPITVEPQLNLVLTPASSTVCTGATATITATGGGSTYAWQGGQSTASATFAPSSNSTYSVTTSNACGTASASANVAVTAVAVINATSSSAAICAGQSSTLTASGATTYTWSPSASLSSANGAAVVSTPAATTIYTITGTSSCGTATTTVTQNVNAAPSVSIAASSSSVCSGSPVTFTASGATTYTWMPGGSTAASYSAAPTTSSTYTVMGATAGCAGAQTVAVTVSPKPTLSVSSTTMTLCSGSTATLTATGTGVAYLWSTGAMTPVIAVSPTITTTYSVGTASTASCTATASVMITVVTCTTTNGIDELSGASISVYPNPNSGSFVIDLYSEQAETVTIHIYDLGGKLVHAENWGVVPGVNHKEYMQTTFGKGIFLTKIATGNGVETVKTVVVK